ncbi:hypothetical protein J2768_000543 [Agrobacterium tumefaciens]|uniref:hypothetical protein n=1 Tax=Agrobacterium tumefaciens TaxID=358 RepID=UPI001AEADC4E|nr:hypothetical protein [Agrobacterium tumefaciens]MBP2538145.1 hypothetical protein [Agrobacterium tumefaciens]
MTEKRIHLAPAILQVKPVSAGSEAAALVEIDDGGEPFSIVVHQPHHEVIARIESVVSSGPMALISAPAFGLCPLSGRNLRVGFIGTAREIADIYVRWSPSVLEELDPEIVPGIEPLIFVWEISDIEPAEAATDFDVGTASCITVRCGEGPEGIRRVIVTGAPYQVRNQIESAKAARRPLAVWLQPRIGIYDKSAGVPLDIGFIQTLRGQTVANP